MGFLSNLFGGGKRRKTGVQVNNLKAARKTPVTGRSVEEQKTESQKRRKGGKGSGKGQFGL
jgi:hypothetical protein